MSRMFGNPLMGGPVPGRAVPAPDGFQKTVQFMWRGNPIRYRIPGLSPFPPVPFAPERYLISAMSIYADIENVLAISVGNREVSQAGTENASIYFDLDPGRHAYIWTDDPFNEFIDVSQYFAVHASSGLTAFLHVTTYTPVRL